MWDLEKLRNWWQGTIMKEVNSAHDRSLKKKKDQVWCCDIHFKGTPSMARRLHTRFLLFSILPSRNSMAKERSGFLVSLLGMLF